MTVNVQQSSYFDMQGNLIWSEPMRFSRMDGIGDVLIYDKIEYRVRRVALAGCVQIVNLERAISPFTRGFPFGGQSL